MSTSPLDASPQFMKRAAPRHLDSEVSNSVASPSPFSLHPSDSKEYHRVSGDVDSFRSGKYLDSSNMTNQFGFGDTIDSTMNSPYLTDEDVPGSATQTKQPRPWRHKLPDSDPDRGRGRGEEVQGQEVWLRPRLQHVRPPERRDSWEFPQSLSQLLVAWDVKVPPRADRADTVEADSTPSPTHTPAPAPTPALNAPKSTNIVPSSPTPAPPSPLDPEFVQSLRTAGEVIRRNLAAAFTEIRDKAEAAINTCQNAPTPHVARVVEAHPRAESPPLRPEQSSALTQPPRASACKPRPRPRRSHSPGDDAATPITKQLESLKALEQEIREAWGAADSPHTHRRPSLNPAMGLGEFDDAESIGALRPSRRRPRRPHRRAGPAHVRHSDTSSSDEAHLSDCLSLSEDEQDTRALMREAERSFKKWQKAFQLLCSRQAQRGRQTATMSRPKRSPKPSHQRPTASSKQKAKTKREFTEQRPQSHRANTRCDHSRSHSSARASLPRRQDPPTTRLAPPRPGSGRAWQQDLHVGRTAPSSDVVAPVRLLPEAEYRPYAVPARVLEAPPMPSRARSDPDPYIFVDQFNQPTGADTPLIHALLR